MADESDADSQEAPQLSEDEDTVEFEIEVVSSSASGASSRASTPVREDSNLSNQKDEIDPPGQEWKQSESNQVISEIVIKQEQETPPSNNGTNDNINQPRDDDVEDRLSFSGQIPIDVHGGDSTQLVKSNLEQRDTLETTLESKNGTANQIECPDVPQAESLSVGDHDLKGAPTPSVGTNAAQLNECTLIEPPNGPESAGDVLSVSSADSAANEATSVHMDGPPSSIESSLCPGNWTSLIAESAGCQQCEIVDDKANPSVSSSEVEPSRDQRKRQRLRASESDPNDDEHGHRLESHIENRALYEPESASIKVHQIENDQFNELSADDEGREGSPVDGDISIQIEGIPSLVEVRAGTLEHDAESSAECRRSESTNDEAKPDDTDFGGFQSALSIKTTPTEESSNELSVDKQQVAWSDQLSSSSSLNNLLNLQETSVTFEDEDLEREFDEEPEFQCRDVQVKRNQNPRDQYELGDELGRGKFGTVFRCVERCSGLKLAAKFMHIRRREDRDDVEREVAIMSELQHKRLLQLYDAFDDGLNEMCLITELVEGGELFERIVDDDFDLTEKKAAIFMRQICEGVEYMHEKRIVHLDMKPENILCLSRTGNRIKLIDFGLARRLDPNKPIRVLFGTPDFAAPEVLAYETVTLETDMWSVGVICYVLLSGLSPFMGDSDMETMANVMRATFDFNDQAFEAISDLAKDFIAKLLIRDPTKRLRPSECLRHTWLERGGRPLEAYIRERRKSSLSVLLDGHHRLALEQAAVAAVLARETSPTTPPTLPASLNWAGHFRPRPSIAESCASASSHQSLDKRRLKKYVVRRKWHKTVHAIMALGRMGANLKLTAAI